MNAISRGQTRSAEWAATIAWLVLVNGVVAWAHWPGLKSTAVCIDDDRYIIQNRLVQRPSWESARRLVAEVFEPSTVPGYYQPLTMLSLMLDSALGGRPDFLFPYHVTNLLLHLLNCALIVLLLRQLFGSLLPAAICGLLFGVHPLTVEPVTWLTERKTLLATAFCLCSIMAYVRHQRLGGGTMRHVSIAAFVVALLAKPTVVALPIMLLIMDVWPLAARRRGWIVPKWPYFAAALLMAVVAWESQRRTAGLHDAPPGGYARAPLLACHLLSTHVAKVAWPVDLTTVPPAPRLINLSNPLMWRGLVSTIGVLAMAWLVRKVIPAVPAGIACFVVMIAPTLGVVSYSWVQGCDKYMYLPVVGLLMTLAWAMDRLGSTRTRMLGLICGVALVAALEVRGTRRYLDVWRDTPTLYRHMLTLAPDRTVLHNNYGALLQGEGRLADAERHFRRAIGLAPRYAAAYANLGSVLAVQGRYREALEAVRTALSINPDLPQALNTLGGALLSLGQADEAIDTFHRALELQPGFAGAHFNLGVALEQQGDLPAAAEAYRLALAALAANDPMRPRVESRLAAVMGR